MILYLPNVPPERAPAQHRDAGAPVSDTRRRPLRAVPGGAHAGRALELLVERRGALVADGTPTMVKVISNHRKNEH